MIARMTSAQIAERIAARTPPRRLIRLIPKQVFVGSLGPLHRPYVMFGDYEEMQGLTVLEAAKRLYGGISEDNPEKYLGFMNHFWRQAWHREHQSGNGIEFDAVKDATEFFVVTVEAQSSDLDLFPGTWKALAFIATDYSRMKGHHDLTERLLRLHRGQRPDWTLNKNHSHDFLGYRHPSDNDLVGSIQGHYYSYLSQDSAWATELLEYFGVDNRCWHGNGYVGQAGEYFARVFLGRNLPLSHPQVVSCVLMKRDEVLPALLPSTEAPGGSDVTWNGINHPESLQPGYLTASHALADAAKRYDWNQVLRLLENPDLNVNGWRVGGKSGYTVLHQAAHGGAPLEVVQAILKRGAFRTQRTTGGDRAVDIARQRGHQHLLEVLQPAPLMTVSSEKLTLIEGYLHQVIRERDGVQELLEQSRMRLPPLEALTEIPGHHLWFPVPGMYGGFHIRLGQVADEPVCIVDSWIRIVGGSEERRLVSTGGIQELSIPLS